MPRWLIAVFVFQFLLGLGASAFGMAPAALRSTQANARSMQTALAQQHPAVQAQGTDAQEPAAMDALAYNLADTSQDLPDDQSIGLFDAGPGRVLFHCPAAIAQAPTSPPLKKQPKRPRPDGTPRSV